MNYDVVYIAKQALVLSLLLSLPVVIVASITGLVFSLFQALTQIQDQTLSYAIKLIFIMAVLYLTADWVGSKLYQYTLIIYNNI
jgi:type III secretion protein S